MRTACGVPWCSVRRVSAIAIFNINIAIFDPNIAIFNTNTAICPEVATFQEWSTETPIAATSARTHPYCDYP